MNLRDHRLKSRIGILLLVASATFVSLAVAEVIVRRMYPEIGNRPLPDDVLGWTTQEYRTFVPSGSKKGKTKKVLFLGDSFLAGSGVRNLEERFPRQVETASQGEFEARILAAGGWGTDQELLAFEQKGKSWRPDLVVLAFCANNDISNILSNQDSNKAKPYFVLGPDGDLRLYSANGQLQSLEGLDGRVQSATFFRSYLFDLSQYRFFSITGFPVVTPGNDSRVDERYKRFGRVEEPYGELYRNSPSLSWSPQVSPTHVSAYVHEDNEMNRYQWALFEALVSQLNTDVREVGAKLAVLLLPVIFNPRNIETIAGGPYTRAFATPDGPFTFRSAEPRDRLAGIAARLSILFFDPTEEFTATVMERNAFLQVWPDPNDRHFSAVGHDILANQVLNALRTEAIATVAPIKTHP